MHIQETGLDEIDLENEDFRISEDLDPPSVTESLRAVGQLNPVVLLGGKGRNRIVCGFRRIRALKRLGNSGVLARTLTEEHWTPIEAMHLAMWDNLSHRRLNPLEKARIVSMLRNDLRIPEEEIIRTYLPLLQLNPAENVLRSYLLLHWINPGLRQCLADGRLTHTSLDTLSAMPESAQRCFAALMEKIRLSASSQKKFLALLEELAASGGSTPDTLLKSAEIDTIADDSRLSHFQRGEKVYDFLYRLKHPRFSEATDQFIDKKKRLGLPGSIRITAHPFFEEPGLHVEFDARDPERFRDLAGSLDSAAKSPELASLFEATDCTGFTDILNQ